MLRNSTNRMVPMMTAPLVPTNAKLLNNPCSHRHLQNSAVAVAPSVT